jgi:acetolactate synthase-1/2/3 large subunit
MAAALYDAGIRYAFGHPGGEVVDLMNALEDGGIRFILTGHESAAAFMAAAIGRLTGVPGVCLSTLGPGACNLVLGVGSAFLDRDPLLAISAITPDDRIHTQTKQNLPLNQLFAPISKWSVALNGVRTADTVSAAIEVAARPPRGPVFLSVAGDTAAAADRADGSMPPPPKAVREQPQAEPAIRLLNAARRPVAVIGVALDPLHDALSIRRFLAETKIPFAVFPQAKGVGDESSSRFLGTLGAAADEPILEALEASDCVLGIGLDPVESSSDWHLRLPVCSVANCSRSHGDYQPVAECTGNVSDLLTEILAKYCGANEWVEDEIRDVRCATDRMLSVPVEQTAAGLAPYHIVGMMRQVLPEETAVVTDVGAHKMLLSQLWRAPLPGSFLVSNGLSAMGFGVPAALASALLEPNRPVVGVIGDGGFGMMVQELETARRLGVKPLFVVFCDRSLSIIKVAQRRKGIPPVGVDFAPVDWAAVSAGFGANAVEPRSLGELKNCIEQWLQNPELTVLAVPIDPDLYRGLSY